MMSTQFIRTLAVAVILTCAAPFVAQANMPGQNVGTDPVPANAKVWGTPGLRGDAVKKSHCGCAKMKKDAGVQKCKKACAKDAKKCKQMCKKHGPAHKAMKGKCMKHKGGYSHRDVPPAHHRAH